MTAAERLECLGKLRPQLVRYARTRLRNPAHAEDAVQDALLAAVRGAVAEEADRAAAAVLDAFAPFHDFYRSRRQAAEALREKALELKAEVERLETIVRADNVMMDRLVEERNAALRGPEVKS